MLAPVGGSSSKVSQPTSSTSSTSTTSSAAKSTGSTPDRFITRSTGEEIPQTCSITRSTGEEIPQTCSVGGVSKFSLTAADFSAK